MATGNLLKTNTVNFNDLIGNGRIYRVPLYQRDYSWKVENWENLWNDLIAIKNLNEPHYMGAIVLQDTQNKTFNVIDGQQRLATLSILALAIINCIDQLIEKGIETESNSQRTDILRRRYLGDTDATSLTYSSKLFLNKNNDDFYQSFLLQLTKPPTLRNQKKSNKLLWDAFEYFSNTLSKQTSITDSGEELSRFLQDTIGEKLLFIEISVANEISAYTVFETLNARGVDLTATDLLKNYLFSLVSKGQDLDHVERQWQRIISIIDTTKFQEFLRYFINSQRPIVRKERLFKVLKNQYSTSQSALELLKELESNAHIYSALSQPNHEYWQDSKEIREYIRILSMFKVKQMYPMLISGYQRLDTRSFQSLLKICVTISFRYLIVSGLNPNALEKVYNDAAISIFQKASQKPKEIFKLLERVYVNDEKFENDFSTLEINTQKNKKLIRYILISLENHIAGYNLDYEDDPASIEHILPENPSEEWDTLFPYDIQERYTYRIGNYTLLEENLNRNAQNKVFSEKHKIYTKSNYKVTQAITTQTWEPETLLRRQELLAAQAAQIWRCDF